MHRFQYSDYNLKLEGLILLIIIADPNVNLHIGLIIGIGNKR